MITYPLRGVNIIFRPPASDQSAEALLPGDIVECERSDGSYIEAVDPIAMKCTGERQCFRMGENGTMKPVKRGSWL